MEKYEYSTPDSKHLINMFMGSRSLNFRNNINQTKLQWINNDSKTVFAIDGIDGQKPPCERKELKPHKYVTNFDTVLDCNKIMT